MLSLKSSNTSSSTKFRKKKFSSVKSGPVLWIDFTDKRTVYSDNSDTLADVDDAIYSVENKAYDRRFGRSSNLSLGRRLVQADAGKQPRFKAGGTNGHSYAVFDGSNDNLTATKASGNVDTNLLTASRINGQSFTFFWVAKSDSATPGGADVIRIAAHDGGSAQDPMTIGTQSDHNYQGWFGDQSDKSGDVYIDSNVQATTNTELWTLKGGGSSSAYIYKNGDTSAGVTNATGKDHVYALDSNNLSNIIQLGGNSNNWDGDIYEVLMYNDQLSDKEIKEIERRLKQKYNL